MSLYTYLWLTLHLFYSTRKILGISTISRKEQVTAETREFECTKMVIPQVQCRGKMCAHTILV